MKLFDPNIPGILPIILEEKINNCIIFFNKLLIETESVTRNIYIYKLFIIIIS